MSDAALRAHLLTLLSTSHAHVDFDLAVAGLPARFRGVRPPGLPHSPWELVEHLRIAQWDILEFSRGPDHRSPEWPSGYWPPTPAPPDDRAWASSVAAFGTDLRALRERVADPRNDLFAPFPWGDGQTLLREALLVADHNAYHVGQLVDARRLLGAWPAGKKR